MLQILAQDGTNGRDLRDGVEEDFFVALFQRRPDFQSSDGGEAALEVWHDLYREGIITWGHKTGIPEDHTNLCRFAA